ncbi:MATE family efflux transporter [Oribacterium sp. WCC10]|uniref:MATE family efflux transporter n=1 Tax=Oribacterium sp. WCC10 TaxID=1855343 RepID=UPI0008F41DD5|nr:MATE family efflux transporter [Oribacterium sp. WCC10]SFG09532.1 putative efflux protein, MATE family [Oribacterium sp. WCC10]
MKNKLNTKNNSVSSTSSQNSITEGVMWRSLILYVIPLIMGTFFQQLYNTVDAVVVGRFVGKEALSAVGGTSAMLINVFVGFFVGISSGAGVVVAQYFGAEHPEEVRITVHTSLMLSIVSGAILTLVGFFMMPVFTVWMKTPEDVLDLTVNYLRIYALGMIPNLIYNMGSGILRAIGDSKRPLYFLIVSCITNIILDVLFVLVLHMGVAGVAIATVLCQLVSAILVIRALTSTKECYRFIPKELKFTQKQLFRILSIGVPAGIQSLMYSLSNVFIQTAINEFGTDAVAAWASFAKIDALYWMASSSFGIGVTTFVGQNYGARLYKRVRSCVRQSAVIMGIITIFFSVIYYNYGDLAFALFTDDPNVMQIGRVMIRYLSPFYITYTAIELFSGSLRGMGDSLRPMFISVLGVCVLRIGWIMFAVPVWHRIETIEASYPLTWITTSIMFLIYYFWYVRKHHIY